MDRSDGIARFPGAGPAGFGIRKRRVALARPGSAAVALLVLAATLALLLGGLHSGKGQRHRRPPPETALALAPLRLAEMPGLGDSIDGQPIMDAAFVERLKQVAARIPPGVLMDQSRDLRVRYLAQAFTPGDDPGLVEGWFQDPAAALAFGCALDDDASLACGPGSAELPLAEPVSHPAPPAAPSLGTLAPAELVPGWHCRPLGIAVGSPAFEPDRCESPG